LLNNCQMCITDVDIHFKSFLFKSLFTGGSKSTKIIVTRRFI